MGTNYYAVQNRPSITKPLHIGKDSAGWLFCFQMQTDYWNEPPVVWNTYNQVKEWLKKYTVDSAEYVIMDEYDRIVPFDEFFGLVDKKQKDTDCKGNPENFKDCKNMDGYRFTEEEFW